MRVKPDGAEKKLRIEPLAPMTDAVIEAAAANDLDNPPLKDTQLGRLYKTDTKAENPAARAGSHPKRVFHPLSHPSGHTP